MRYEPAQRLLRLALALAGTRAGLSLDEIAAELQVGRRTAERLRDSLAEIFPQLDAWDDDARVRRWRLPGGAIAGVVEPRAECVTAIDVVALRFAPDAADDAVGWMFHPSQSMEREPDGALLLRSRAGGTQEMC